VARGPPAAPARSAGVPLSEKQQSHTAPSARSDWLAKSEAWGQFPLATPRDVQIPLSERLRTLPSKQESRVRLPGGTPRRLVRPCDAPRCGRGRRALTRVKANGNLGVCLTPAERHLQVRVLPLVQRARAELDRQPPF